MFMKNIKLSSFLILVLSITVIALLHLLVSPKKKVFFGRQHLRLSSFFQTDSDNLPDYVLNFKKPVNMPIHCVPYSTIRGKIPICIHHSREVITDNILRTGVWERGHGDSIQRILSENPDYELIDIGANLGMFSLLAASLKRPALAVEAMDINVEKFHQSVVVNRFEEYITLVTKPLSDKHETLKFIVSGSNLGRTALIKNKTPKMHGALHYENKTALVLDDLIGLMTRKKAVMVIDVEGNEGKVLRGGLAFFDSIDISHVFMEWFHLPHVEQKYISEFFVKRGYLPYNFPNFTTRLDPSEFNKWGSNVFWKK